VLICKTREGRGQQTGPQIPTFPLIREAALPFIPYSRILYKISLDKMVPAAAKKKREKGKKGGGGGKKKLNPPSRSSRHHLARTVFYR